MAFETRRPERVPGGAFDQLRRRRQRSLRVHSLAHPFEQWCKFALRNRLHQARDIALHRLERAMLAGDLKPADLPSAWAAAMRDMLGVAPDNDREGCLQDIHWYDGNWGYFPTYTLGALIAAQLFEAARRDVPGLVQAIAEGEFAPLLAWARERVHLKGSLLSTAELVETATGRPLGTASFERHLRDRYLS